MNLKIAPFLFVLILSCGCTSKSSFWPTSTDIPFQPYEIQNTAIINADLDSVFEATLSRSVLVGSNTENALPNRNEKEIKLTLRSWEPEDFIDCGKYIQTGFGREEIYTHLGTKLSLSGPREKNIVGHVVVKFTELGEYSTKVEINCDYIVSAIANTTIPEPYYEYENRIRNENKIINGKLVNVPVPYTEKITKYKDKPYTAIIRLTAQTTYTDGDKCQSNQTLEKKVLALIEQEVTARQSGQK